MCGQRCCSREAVRGSAGRYCLSLIFILFYFFYILVSYFQVEEHVLSGDLNLLYWLSVAAAPTEPWEG